MDTPDPDKRALRRRLAAIGVGLLAVFAFAVLSGVLVPGLPFAGWICIFLGYVVYRIFLRIITPPKHCPKCGTLVSSHAASCPDCGRILVSDG